MRRDVVPSDFERLGLDAEASRALADRVRPVLSRPGAATREGQEAAWRDLQGILLGDARWRWTFAVHERLYDRAYAGRAPSEGPGPAWFPTAEGLRTANLGRLRAERGLLSYAALHRWSVDDREAFWRAVIAKLDIRFRTEPSGIREPDSEETAPAWLPGAELNIAESCFQSDEGKTAILYGGEDVEGVRALSYGELRRLSSRVANGLAALGIARGDRVALFMPMTPESVAIYLGTVLAGAVAVGIADSSAAPELAKRVRIAGAKAVFTIDGYVRDGKTLGVYEKVVEADAPRAVVLPREGTEAAELRRQADVAWADFLGDDAFDPVACRPDEPTNILFSSGTTKDPKAIVWTHTTPIKCAADAYLHHDTRPTDVLAWPTSFGWMMGPWLTYASLVNRATMALYPGAPQRRAFGTFVQEAGVTMLGVVPKLVRAWKAERAMEGLDWSRIRLFSSTGEPSTPGEMLYLMFLAGYRPIVEYCGGTEIGGGYITGTVVQPCAPGTFTTAAMGLDLVILDEGTPADRGEVFLVPPSIGLSNELLNYDHRQEYYEGVPRGPGGERLRRHGDQIERLGGGFYRHHGRIDDMININGVKTSSEEIRSVLPRDEVYDAKPVAVTLGDTGQHALVVYAVPRDAAAMDDADLRRRLQSEFRQAIREKLNPLLAHVHDVVLVPELPQAGPGKTRTMKDLQRDYRERVGSDSP